MSKIGKINIPIPEKVKVLLSGNIVNIEGPLGKKSLNIDLDVFDLKINSEDKKPTLSLELKYHSANPVISAFERVSKPGRRIFSSASGLR